MVSILWLTLLIILLLYFVGFGFTQLLVPKSLGQYSIWIMPWVGIMFTAIVGVYMSLLRIPMNSASYIILLIASGLLILALKKKLFVVVRKSDLLIGVLTIGCLIFNLYPLLMKIGYPTTISAGNLDPISYTTVADFFNNNVITDAYKNYQPYDTYMISVGDLVIWSFRWGSPVVLSFISSILMVRSYVIFSIVITLLFALSFPLIWIITKILYPQINDRILFFLAATYAFNSTLLYMLYNVFFAQFMFVGILCLALIFTFDIAQSKLQRNFIRFTKSEVLLAVAISAVSTIYPEGLAYLIIPVGFWIILNAIQKRSWSELFRFKVLIISALINPYTMYTGIQQFIKVAIFSSHLTWIGWEPIRYASPMEILGLYNLHYYRPMPTPLLVFTGMIIFVVWVLSYWMSKQKPVTLSYLLVFFSVYVSTRYLGNNYYTYHRAITYTLFIYVVFFVGGLSYIMEFFKSKLIHVCIYTIVLLLSARSSLRIMKQLYWHNQAVDRPLISLETLGFNGNIPFYTTDVIIGEYDLWRRLWRSYILWDKKAISKQNYDVKLTLDNPRRILIEKDMIDRLPRGMVVEEKIWENGYYELIQVNKVTIDK